MAVRRPVGRRPEEGREDLTQANVVKITNHFTNNNSGGVSTVTNWETAHTQTVFPLCDATVQVQGKKFVPVFGKGNQVFVCLGKSVKDPVPVAHRPARRGHEAERHCSGGETRTLNLAVNSRSLCRLSYPGRHAALPDCAAA